MSLGGSEADQGVGLDRVRFSPAKQTSGGVTFSVRWGPIPELIRAFIQSILPCAGSDRDLPPFGNFVPDEVPKFAGTGRRRFDTCRTDTLDNYRILERAYDGFVELGDDVRRCAGRSNYSKPSARLKTRQSRLRDGWHAGQNGDAVPRRYRQCFDLTGLDQRDRRQVHHPKGDVTAENVVGERRRPFVWHQGYVHAGHLVE